jgi:hypothetical protein
MLGAENVWTWLVARVQTMLPDDWSRSAGELFREGTQAISQFAVDNGLTPDELLNEGIDLGRRKLTGIATKEHAESERNYAEAAKAFVEGEDRKIETELKRRAFESDVRKREADARGAEADADLKEIKVLDARYELIRKLEASGLMLHRGEEGNLTIFPKPEGSPRLIPKDLVPGSDSNS